MLQAIRGAGQSPDERARLVEGLGRLEPRALPPLVASLEMPDPVAAADVADALGRMRDPRAVPALLHAAAAQDVAPPLRDAARRAVETITGRPFDAQPNGPARTLADLAWAYHRGRVDFPADAVELWTWEGDAPRAERVDRREAASRLGLNAARQALDVDPSDRTAQVALLSLSLDRAARRHGAATVAARDPDGSFAAALAAGPDALAEVLRSAVADRKTELGQAAVAALARVSNRDLLAAPGAASPLVAALDAPDRRVQFAAAEALASLDLPDSSAGSSRLVPTLARFVGARPEPRAVVIDGNASRANSVGDALRRMGYDPITAVGGADGFPLAAENADVEFVVLEPRSLQGAMRWRDLLTNLRADARTAGLPVFVTGPLGLRDQLEGSLAAWPRTAFVVAPGDPELFRRAVERELARMDVRPMSADERANYARRAAESLARLARPGTAYERQLASFEPRLSASLAVPATGAATVAALGDTPAPGAQQRLADALLDPALPLEVRTAAGSQLVRSVQRYGPLLTGTQERRLAERLAAEADPALRSACSAVVGALRPSADAAGARLRQFRPIAEPPAPDPAPTDGDARR
jgi:hypothetical protein